MGTTGVDPDSSLTAEEHPAGVLERLLVSSALVLVVAVIYQFIVGGIKIEIAGGRLILDTSGFVYWWRIFTGQVAAAK